jgi:hypothetical protein
LGRGVFSGDAIVAELLKLERGVGGEDNKVDSGTGGSGGDSMSSRLGCGSGINLGVEFMPLSLSESKLPMELKEAEDKSASFLLPL